MLLYWLFCCLFVATSCERVALAAEPDERYKADLLVVVAHPDDESVIGAYLARAAFDEKKRVAVVYCTRGNGGGNAQGPEQAASLGLVREIEGRRALEFFGIFNVWFLNGPDTPGQDVLRSLETWNHGDTLGRVVRLIRLTRPSVVISWLPGYAAGENHGDHQASGVIATEAFDLAGDPTAFPEQITPACDPRDILNLTEGLRPWQPQKLYFATDAYHYDFLAGRGPVYSSKERSPSKGESYAILAAKSCAFHLTQSDSGQLAQKGLKTGDLGYLAEPTRLILGKTHVASLVTADIFAGVNPKGVVFSGAPGYAVKAAAAPSLILGGPWQYYDRFRQAHGLRSLNGLLPLEIMLNPSGDLFLPLIVENPTASVLRETVTIKLPQGWRATSDTLLTFTVSPFTQKAMQFSAKAPKQSAHEWETIHVMSEGSVKSNTLDVRVHLGAGAMSQ